MLPQTEPGEYPDRILAIMSHRWLKRLTDWPFAIVRALGSPVYIEYRRADILPPEPPVVASDEVAKAGDLAYQIACARRDALEEVLRAAEESPSVDEFVHIIPTAEVDLDPGVDYAIERLAEVLGIPVDDFSWDAATETHDGDVRAVISNALTAAFGDDWQELLD